jgi:hypothetical protein
MGWTAADLALIKAAILAIVANPVKTVEINGRRWTKYDLDDLIKLKDEMEADVLSATYGGAQPMTFVEVDD